MKVFRIRIDQHTNDGRLNDQAVVDVRARTAQEGIRRALTHVRGNGYAFVKSRPLEITYVETISHDLV